MIPKPMPVLSSGFPIRNDIGEGRSIFAATPALCAAIFCRKRAAMRGLSAGVDFLPQRGGSANARFSPARWRAFTPDPAQEIWCAHEIVQETSGDIRSWFLTWASRIAAVSQYDDSAAWRGRRGLVGCGKRSRVIPYLWWRVGSQ